MAVLAARAMMEVRDETKNIHPFFGKRASEFWGLFWVLADVSAGRLLMLESD